MQTLVKQFYAFIIQIMLSLYLMRWGSDIILHFYTKQKLTLNGIIIWESIIPSDIVKYTCGK